MSRKCEVKLANQLLVDFQKDHNKRIESLKQSYETILRNIDIAAQELLEESPEDKYLTLEEILANKHTSTSKVFENSDEDTFYSAESLSQKPGAEVPPPKRVPTPVSSQRHLKRVCRVQPNPKTSNPIARQVKCPGERLFSMNGSPLVTGGPVAVPDVASLHINMGPHRTLTLLPGDEVPPSLPTDPEFIEKLRRLHASVSEVLEQI